MAAASMSWGPDAGRRSTSPRCFTPTRPNDLAPAGFDDPAPPPDVPCPPMDLTTAPIGFAAGVEPRAAVPVSVSAHNPKE